MNGLDLKQMRIDADLTQEELAERLHISRKTVNLYENGSPIPPSKIKMIRLILKNQKSEKDKDVTKSYKEVSEMSKLIESLEKIISTQDKLIKQLEADNERLGLLCRWHLTDLAVLPVQLEMQLIM